MLAYDPSEQNPVLAAFLRDQVPEELRPPMAVHGKDFMLRFFLGQRADHREAALVDYFQSGWSLARAVRAVGLWWFGSGEDLEVLDFGAGFGRGTRYLTRLVSPDRICAMDLFPEMEEFQEEIFGVRASISSHRPEELDLQKRFDLVLVSSLFSHLPPDLFGRWLARLWQTVADDGLLLLSVHGAETRPPGRGMPKEGILFESDSEIPELDGGAYGSTWVEEDYLGSLLEALGLRYHRFPRGLWALQDLYAVGERIPEGPPPRVGQPAAHLDLLPRHPSPRRLELTGWAVDFWDRELEIRLLVGGEPAGRTTPHLERPEAAGLLRRPGRGQVGFWLPVERDRPFDPREICLVKAVPVDGDGEYVLACDTLQGLRAYARQLELARELEIARTGYRDLKDRLEWIEATRLWRAGQVWWRWKGRLTGG
ncbi:MAG: class I SAM-dependent methyltransferase [Thermoanaerobaculia bacterium]|nr:class I SAM-dependent methyltransferase [Thermoanaerobaculia bacterium]